MRWAVLVICSVGSGWLYREVVRLAAEVPSAEPTGASEVLPWVRVMTHHSIQSVQNRTQGFEWGVLGSFAGLFVLYGVMVWVAKGLEGMRLGWFVTAGGAAAAVFMGVLLCAPVMFSSDVYAYAFYGRLLGVYGVDAHAAAPAASLADPFVRGGWYDVVPSVYGPLWTVISAGVTWAGGGHVGLTLLLFRGLEAGAVLCSAAMIWLILKDLRPEVAAIGSLLFLWNPLVLIESALGGHNDACMMALALLAVWLHLRGWKAGAVVALMLSALVKEITLPLAGLYILMTLRETAGWKERGMFLVRAGVGAAVAVLLAMAAAKMQPNVSIVRTAGSAGFYRNNYHELIFKRLRRMLGEPANTLDAPMDFATWWVAASDGAVLHVGLSNKSRDLGRLKPGQPLLALSDKDSREWLRVFDPAERIIGFVNWSHLYVIPAPPNAQSDPVVRQLSVSPQDWPTVARANRLIRVTTWGLFAAFGLLAAWKCRDLESFLMWGTMFFLAAQLLVFTKIWPWYAVWPMAFGSLIPGTWPTRLAVLLSAGMLASYALLGCCNTRLEWVYDYRSLFTIVLPAVLLALWRGGSYVAGRFAKGTLSAG
jgi:hypothetical protein